MNRETNLHKIQNILANLLEDDSIKTSITEDTKLINGVGEHDLGLSSIDYVEFIVEVEKEFDIVFEFEFEINTVADLLSYIENYHIERGN